MRELREQEAALPTSRSSVQGSPVRSGPRIRAFSASLTANGRVLPDAPARTRRVVRLLANGLFLTSAIAGGVPVVQAQSTWTASPREAKSPTVDGAWILVQCLNGTQFAGFRFRDPAPGHDIASVVWNPGTPRESRDEFSVRAGSGYISSETARFITGLKRHSTVDVTIYDKTYRWNLDRSANTINRSGSCTPASRRAESSRAGRRSLERLEREYCGKIRQWQVEITEDIEKTRRDYPQRTGAIRRLEEDLIRYGALWISRGCARYYR